MTLFMEAPATAIFDTAASGVGSDVAVRTNPQCTDADAELRVICCWSDWDNYLFGQLLKTAGLGSIRLGEVKGGTERWLTDAADIDATEEQMDGRGELCLSFEPGPVQEAESFVWGSGGVANVHGDNWTSPDKALLPLALDGGVASYAFTSGGTSDALFFQGWPAALPPGSIIDGIEVGITARDGSETASQIKVLTMRMLNGDGNPVGDIYSDSNFTDFNPNFSTHAMGGSTDDLNAGIGWEDVSSPLFGFFVILENHDEFERHGEIDSAGIQIWFTTPDRQPGKLRLSYQAAGVEEMFAARVEADSTAPVA